MDIRVYLADESDYFREGLRVLLEARGDIRIVGGSADAAQAVTDASGLRPDVLVMDIAMPRCGGIEAIALLRASAPSTRVIILSTHATTEHVYHALQAGASGYLLKGSAAAELSEAVHAVHAGRRYVSHKLAEMLADEYLRRYPGVYPGVPPPGDDRAGLPTHPAADDSIEDCRRRLIRAIAEADSASVAKLSILHGLVLAE